MLRHPNKVKKLEKESELKQYTDGERVQDLRWDGPGEYAIYNYAQKCPRGCCFDDVVKIEPIE